MKLQHLAIIFIIIILPISLVIGEYIQTQIDTIYLQTQYSKRLQDATHDAIKAFQLNTVNNKYSSISDSKIRDIEASVATFYNSLGTSMGASGYDQDTLKEYIPAMLYTMYDGYYIYGKYFNYKLGENGEYQYGLKPYIYYSCRYIYGNNYDFVVNYTLDNSITIYGKINGKYVTDSGYVINPSLVGNVESIVSYVKGVYKKDYPTKITYDGVTIEKEILKEQLIVIAENGVAIEPTKYEYVRYNNQKIYKENGENRYFYYKNNKKEYLSDEGKVLRDDEVTELRYVQTMTENGHLYSNSAVEYYASAKDFSERLKEYGLTKIKQENAVDNNGNKITDFATNIENTNIFDFNKNNDPLLEGSSFNEHRMSVIRKSIETNLSTAIANYNAGSSSMYEFQMPIFTDSDWDKILNNISLSVFMQGIPMKAKYFNSYCIVTNNKNEEVVTQNSIYILSERNNITEVHLPGCTELIDSNDYKIIGAYNAIDFERQTVVISQGDERYYYPQYASKCYNCIVNAAQTYDINGIISNNLQKFDVKSNQYQKYNKDISLLRKTYLTALARERYDLYRTNGYFINN